MKKSKNDYSGPAHTSVILNVNLAMKSPYVRPVDNYLHCKKAIQNLNWKACYSLLKPKSENCSKTFWFCFDKFEKIITLIPVVLFKSQYFYGPSIKPYQTC